MQLLILLKAALVHYALNQVKRCGTALVNDNNNLLQTSTESKRELLNTIILEYFQYQGVRSLNLMICPSNNTSSKCN